MSESISKLIVLFIYNIIYCVLNIFGLDYKTSKLYTACKERKLKHTPFLFLLTKTNKLHFLPLSYTQDDVMDTLRMRPSCTLTIYIV